MQLNDGEEEHSPASNSALQQALRRNLLARLRFRFGRRRLLLHRGQQQQQRSLARGPNPRDKN